MLQKLELAERPAAVAPDWPDAAKNCRRAAGTARRPQGGERPFGLARSRAGCGVKDALRKGGEGALRVPRSVAKATRLK